ncbi:hypothetical protein ACIP93_29630 [Streptomyces sp. NPDC088745]|uniref:hypothetical protein n=1 Tax=Streptomyces sp. NPDC088745 TaxID=3365884 RepID=UPI0037F53994
MTSEQYREKAEELLTSRHYLDLPDRLVAQADVWARLAVAAAITETSKGVPADGE